MKKNGRRFLALLLLVTVLSGCTIGGRQVYFSLVNPFTVFSIGPLSCGIKEARVYLINYKNIYGNVGSTNLWSEDFASTDIEEGIKRSAIYHLSRVYSLNLYAKEKDIILDDKEKNAVDEATKEYYDSLNEKERKETGVHLRDIRKMYERYALAEKVYHEIMKSVDEEVSEDEARIMDAYVLHIQNENKRDKINHRIKNGVDFEILVSEYSNGDKGEISFGRGVYPKKVEAVAFSLEDDEISKEIKTRDGYYWIKCVKKYDADQSEENKNHIITERKQAVFNKIIDEQSAKYYSRINTALIKRIHFDDEDDMETDSFFSTIEERLSH